MGEARQTVLAVDDSPLNIDTLLDTLGLDYHVRVATSGPAALKSVKRAVPDLILLDVMMPGMDGFEVCRRLKDDALFRNIPIIFITALNGGVNEANGLGLGAVDYITKPFNPAIVKARVANHLELKRHRDHLSLLVAEKTRQLETAQKELVKKALEAGCNQALEIILHNIGNAVTPVLLYTDLLAMDDGKQVVAYLKACYRDLFDRKGNLDAYLARDPRGMNMFSYMGKLIETLQKQEKDTKAAVSTIRKAVDHIAEILNAQRSSSAVCGGGKSLNVDEVVEKAVLIQSPAFEKRGIQVQSQLDSGAALAADGNAFLQVILNLFKNACEAIDTLEGNGRIKQIIVRTFRKERRVFVEISDSGIGIAPEKIDEIQEPGVSGKGSSGFGLFFCKNWVEENGGTFAIKSDGTEKGATVRMTFEMGMAS
jgi:CheY-like chemotaxis protein